MADECPVLAEIDSEIEAKRCVAGGQVNGQICRTAGFVLNLPNAITREYLLHQQASVQGQTNKQQQRVDDLKNRIGQEGVNRLMLNSENRQELNVEEAPAPPQANSERRA